MSYYLGQSAIPVRPVTRRATLTRSQRPRNVKKYLQRTGRRPLNRRAYPVMGTPVAVDMSMQPGGPGLGRAHHGTTSDFSLGADDIVLSVRGRSGKRYSTNPFQGGAMPYGPVTVGQDYPAGYAPAPLSEIQQAVDVMPSVPSVITAPAVAAPASSGFIGGIFDSAANFMKNISVSVDPLKTIQAVQQIIKPNQVGTLAQQLQRFGINPSYLGLPINQYSAQYGYQAAGINWAAYLPWIAGGAALLFVVPMLMPKK